MTTAQLVYEALDRKAPFSLQMDFDNAGFLVGYGDAPVSHILVALDITMPVIEEAAAWGAQLIVSHHPVIFHPVRSLRDNDPTGRKLLALAERKMAVICAHTNLDAVQDGVNDQLAKALGLSNVEQLHQDGVDISGAPYGIGRVGEVELCTLAQFAEKVKKTLTRTQEQLDKVLGYHYPMQLMRPPYGNTQRANGTSVCNAIAYAGYAHAVLWDVSQTNAQKARKAVQNGSILLYHTNWKDVECLETLIPALLEDGYVLCTVSELLGLDAPATSTDLYTFHMEDYVN